MDIYTASDKLPDILRDPVKGKSTAVTCTAFTEAHNTHLSRWGWLKPIPTISLPKHFSMLSENAATYVLRP